MHYEFLSHCEIVARLDLTPLHEFFDDPYRSLIQSLIQTKFMHVLSNKPIQIFNVATNSFLCWDPITNKKSNEKDHHFLVRSIPKEHLKETTSKQCLWKINWSPFAEKYTPADILNGSSRIYIQPAEIPETHHALMILSCRPAQYDEMTPKQLHFSRIKALRLLLPDTTQYEKSSWSLEYPNNQLKYVTDYQLNIKLNINEHIRRIKPLLEGDEIQFQQVGLLTAFYPVEKSGSGADPQSVKNTKSRNNVLCIDEDIIHERYAKNTIWKIQLPPHHSQPIVSHPRVFRFEDLTKGIFQR
ncbi:hypothetical protein G6F56_011770 [Rhizopus delemar]|nr:hypothetical protein G6F56_011770 [Rhizopus delemar]